MFSGVSNHGVRLISRTPALALVPILASSTTSIGATASASTTTTSGGIIHNRRLVNCRRTELEAMGILGAVAA